MNFIYLIKLIAIFTSTAIGTGIIIKAVIKVSMIKHLFDEPTEDRKIHISRTPNLGGIGIYAAFLFAVCVFVPQQQLEYIRYMIAASLILVAIGLKDDLVGLSPTKKLVAQIATAIIIAQMTNIRITSFYGFMGIYELAEPVSILVTVLVSIFIYNAMNLIDGIDGLAGGIGLLASATYAFFFFQMGYLNDCLIAVAFSGALLGFLYFNLTPAKIFMGDTGSLLVGFMLAIFSIRFIELNKAVSLVNAKPYFNAAPAISISILIIPIFDTLRVFILRVLRGQSPFAADRNHLHHRFLDMKFTHLQATFVLICTNILFIALAIMLQDIGNAQLITFVLLLAVLVNTIFWNLTKKQQLPATSSTNVNEEGKLDIQAGKGKHKSFEEVSVKLKLPLN
jgi:UDP-N-acetylmuramyl pentapeptide phosphotransferase/UDP-N-acetylglucosamine-1-phosphate transferase